VNPIISNILFRANTFIIYGEIKRWFVSYNKNKLKLENNVISDYITIPQILLSASLATGICTIFECPFEYFKIQMQVMNMNANSNNKFNQVENKSLYKNSFDCGAFIYKTNGFFGIYSGFKIHLIKNLCGGFYSIGLYEAVRKSYSEKNNVNIKDLPLVINFFANFVCWLGHFISFPVDVIKSNIQSDEVIKKNRKYSSILKTVKQLYLDGGIKRFYQGVLPSVLKTIPSQSIMNITRFWIVENV
jgi:hypothetical protein